MVIIGINGYHPDASVAVLKDGELIWAAEEERFSRVKHASGFPRLALQQAMKDLALHPKHIRTVALSKNPKANLLPKLFYGLTQRPDLSLVQNRMKAFTAASNFQKDFYETLNIRPRDMFCPFIHVEHHMAHAASSFFVSGFDRAAVLTFDGMGDFSSAALGFGHNRSIRIFKRVHYPHSAGFLYTAGTQFLGFLKFGDEYKVMGLAAYGKPVYLEAFRNLYSLKSAGGFELNLDYFAHASGRAVIRWEGGLPVQDLLCTPRWKDLFGPERKPQDPVTQREEDMAASLQAALEEIYFHALNGLYQETHEPRLALAGGVAFNSVANGKITQRTPFKEVYIQAAAGDAGTAVGAACYAYHVYNRKIRHGYVMQHASTGPEFTEAAIESALREKNILYEKCAEAERVCRAVQVLTEGGIVGWFQGRMEFGPRALGNRSILADPRRADMKDILNSRIKHREAFRPFAPIVLEEKAHEYFEMDCTNSPFMLKVFPVKEGKKTVIPAVTHVDGTARVQTVSKQTQPLLWALLKAFEEKTGCAVLLNTSFNDNEPIVCSPAEAIDCFQKTKMDLLVMNNHLIFKP